MLNVFMVVWRESFEAVLVVGILAAALRKQPGSFARARSFLLIGVAGGVVLACLLAGALLFAQSELQGAMLEWFQTGILFVAAVLIVHTCLWMRTHGRNLKRNIETSVSGALDGGSLWAVASLAAIAIGREGMETVLFLYGTGLEALEAGEVGALAVSAAGGFSLALTTGWLLSRGLLFVSRAWFFRISTSCLLVIAGGLIVQATGRLVQEGALPALMPQVWDTSWLLDESTTAGGLVSMFTGYQNAPSLMVVLCYVSFWACCLGASVWTSRGIENASAGGAQARV